MSCNHLAAKALSTQILLCFQAKDRKNQLPWIVHSVAFPPQANRSHHPCLISRLRLFQEWSQRAHFGLFHSANFEGS